MKDARAGDVFQELKARGFVAQCTDEAGLRAAFVRGRAAYYIGFDPTAESLHVGSLVPIMAMAHLQRAGHFPIAVLGGGTAMVGDPSGKTEMRRIMPRAEIARNAKGIARQIGRYLALRGGRGVAVDNASWLLKLSLVEFLREIGSRFRVNEMIKAEGYRERLTRETGLSFLEFSYQMLQAYDFLTLFDRYGCVLQMGGDDQWGNITAGTDLIRRMRGKGEGAHLAFGLTFPLITTSTGRKMGKTEQGAVWLDARRTTPYDFYQYWINTDDRDVVHFLKLFTFLPLSAIEALTGVEGASLRQAKETLAYEATALCHGAKEAARVREASRKAFSGEASAADVPAVSVPRARFQDGIDVLELLVLSGLAASRGEARRLVLQGGVCVNERRIENTETMFSVSDLQNSALVIRKGKKQYRRVSAV